MNWTNLNNFWYTKSWRYLRLMVILLSTTPEKCHHSTLWNAELFTWSKLYDFPQKLDNFKNSCYVLQKLKLEFQIFSVIAADKSYYCQRWHVFPIFFDTDLSPCCARLQPMSQENWWGWHGFYAYYVFSLHLVHIPDHSVNSQGSHSKKNFISKKSKNPISAYENLSICSWEYWRQLIAEKWKMTFQFLKYSGYILQEVDKSKIAYVRFLQHFVYKKLFTSVHFCVSYSRKGRGFFETQCSISAIKNFFRHNNTSRATDFCQN